MPENPYIPPSAPVHDFSSEPKRQRPRSVQIAVALLAVATVTSFCREAYLNADLIISSGLMIVLVLLCFLIQRIYAGRNWARLLFTALILLGSLNSVPGIFAEFGTAPIEATASLLFLATQLVALFLLFDEPGGSWFSKASRVPDAGV